MTGQLRAVDGVSFEIRQGETFGLWVNLGAGNRLWRGRLFGSWNRPAGEWCSKDGHHTLGPRKLRPLRRDLQIVFQDPHGSLNPRRRIGATIGEPLAVHRILKRGQRRDEVERLLAAVGLGRSTTTGFRTSSLVDSGSG